MPQEFKNKLKSIVEKVVPEGKARIQSKVDTVLRMGVSSYEDLLKILEKREADVEILKLICWVLGRYEDETATTTLLNTLNAQEPTLRAEAIRSLGLLESPDSLPPILDRLINDEDSRVRSESTRAIASLGGDEAISSLVKVLENVKECPEVRGSAADALSCQFGNDQVIKALINTLKDDSVEVRFWSVFTLGQIAGSEALPELERLAATDSQVLEKWGSIQDEARQAIEYIKSNL